MGAVAGCEATAGARGASPGRRTGHALALLAAELPPVLTVARAQPTAVTHITLHTAAGTGEVTKHSNGGSGERVATTPAKDNYHKGGGMGRRTAAGQAEEGGCLPGCFAALAAACALLQHPPIQAVTRGEGAAVAQGPAPPGRALLGALAAALLQTAAMLAVLHSAQPHRGTCVSAGERKRERGEALGGQVGRRGQQRSIPRCYSRTSRSECP